MNLFRKLSVSIALILCLTVLFCQFTPEISAKTAPNTIITNIAEAIFKASPTGPTNRVYATNNITVKTLAYFTIRSNIYNTVIPNRTITNSYIISNRGNYSDCLFISVTNTNGFTTTTYIDMNTNGIIDGTDYITNITSPIAEDAIIQIIITVFVPFSTPPDNNVPVIIRGNPLTQPGTKIVESTNYLNILNATNNIAEIYATDGLKTARNLDGTETLADLDTTVFITLMYPPYISTNLRLWYDIGAEPDAITTNANRNVDLQGSGIHWQAVIPADDPEVFDGSLVRFILEIDNTLYYLEKSTNTNSYQYIVKSIIEQSGGFTVLDNLGDPDAGDCMDILYNLKKDTHVNISVFDINGDQIIEIVNQHVSAGRYSARWCFRNHAGRSVAVGVYFIHFHTDNSRETRKAVRIKR